MAKVNLRTAPSNIPRPRKLGLYPVLCARLARDRRKGERDGGGGVGGGGGWRGGGGRGVFSVHSRSDRGSVKAKVQRSPFPPPLPPPPPSLSFRIFLTPMIARFRI